MSKSTNTSITANKTAFKAQRRNTLSKAESSLKREIDAGVRYFWSKRGGVPYLTTRGGIA